MKKTKETEEMLKELNGVYKATPNTPPADLAKKDPEPDSESIEDFVCDPTDSENEKKPGSVREEIIDPSVLSDEYLDLIVSQNAENNEPAEYSETKKKKQKSAGKKKGKTCYLAVFPDESEPLPEIGENEEAVLFYDDSNDRMIPIRLARKLAELERNGTIRYVESADPIIVAAWIGHMIALDDETEFVLAKNIQGGEEMVKFWKEQGSTNIKTA